MEKLTLSVSEVGVALGISRPKAYELTNSADFPCIRVGSRKVIPIEAFKKWLEAQTSGQIGTHR